jgi:GGDEF domain-containing protein
MNETLRVLCVGMPAPACEAETFEAETVADAAGAFALWAGDGAFDAIELDGDRVVLGPKDVEAFAARAALVVVGIDPDAQHALGWLRRGAEDVMSHDELASPAGSRRLRFAVERQRSAQALGHPYSTDLATGLPHRQQLVEHLSQLLALREREPAPMAVLALRIEGLVLRATPGDDATDPQSDALRRKIAVRLRAGVRASDVVAAIDADCFAVLLGSILAPSDADRVAEKLVAALVTPFALADAERSVGVAVGIGQYPQDGKDADRLLRRSLALAAAAPATGAAGATTTYDASGAARVAANDDN